MSQSLEVITTTATRPHLANKGRPRQIKVSRLMNECLYATEHENQVNSIAQAIANLETDMLVGKGFSKYIDLNVDVSGNLIKQVKNYLCSIMEVLFETESVKGYTGIIETADAEAYRHHKAHGTRIPENALMHHSFRVGLITGLELLAENYLAVEKGNGLKHTTADISHGIRAAFLHDLGKAHESVKYLHSAPRELTDEERRLMKRHAEYGALLLKENGEDNLTIAVARDHHKKPVNGKITEAIDPLVAAVLVADITDAMVIGARPYRKIIENPWAAITSEIHGVNRRVGGLLNFSPEASPDDVYGKHLKIVYTLFGKDKGGYTAIKKAA